MYDGIPISCSTTSDRILLVEQLAHGLADAAAVVMLAQDNFQENKVELPDRFGFHKIRAVFALWRKWQKASVEVVLALETALLATKSLEKRT
jgi:hypothetical protein